MVSSKISVTPSHGLRDTHFDGKNTILSPNSGQNSVNCLEISVCCLGSTPVNASLLTSGLLCVELVAGMAWNTHFLV